MPYTPGGILSLGRGNTAIYPNMTNCGRDDQGNPRWSTSHRNWHLSTGETDDHNRPPAGAVFAMHDCDDGGYRTFWADSFADAVAKIDAMPDYGDTDWDYK